MPDLVVLLDDQVVRRVAFGQEPITIGRTDANGLSVDDMSVSRNHARIDREAGGYFLTDLDSANGTFVNDRPVTRARIYHNDRIGVGRHQLLFCAPEAQPEEVAPPESEGEAADETIVLQPAADQAYLTLRPGRRPGSVHVLPVPVATVGRAEGCDVRVVDWFVEPVQARVELDGPVFLVHALGEPGRVRLNGSPVEAAVRLSQGDIIEMGVTRLIFSLDEEDAVAARTRPLPDYLPVAVAGAAAAEDLSVRAALDAALAEAGEDLQVGAEIAPSEPEESQGAGAVAQTDAPDAARAAGPSSEEPYEFVAEAGAEGVEDEAAPEAVAPPPEPIAEPMAESVAEPIPEVLAESPVAPSPEGVRGEEDLSEKDRKAVVLWERALQNPSAAVRKQAAEQLRRLVGRDRA
jgi:pSer/pThr/pTyr-binding forkhead associated (FHA) protein